MEPVFLRIVPMLLLLGAASPRALWADAFVKEGSASVIFNATGTAGLQIEGKTADLQLRDGDGTLTVQVPLENLTTGIALRDRHMKEKYLETTKFPNAELKIPRAELKLPPDGSKVEAQANGILSLHGREKPVSFTYSVHRSGGTYEVSGTLPLNMNEYGISVPSYLGITVRPQVQVLVEFRAKEG